MTDEIYGTYNIHEMRHRTTECDRKSRGKEKLRIPRYEIYRWPEHLVKQKQTEQLLRMKIWNVREG